MLANPLRSLPEIKAAFVELPARSEVACVLALLKLT
jgi:hypothetical protein